jgi:hypothetical protein
MKEGYMTKLTPNTRLAVRAYWQKGGIVWGHVMEDFTTGSDWMLEHGGLTESNFLFKPDNDGHSRLVKVADIVE